MSDQTCSSCFHFMLMPRFLVSLTCDFKLVRYRAPSNVTNVKRITRSLQQKHTFRDAPATKMRGDSEEIVISSVLRCTLGEKEKTNSPVHFYPAIRKSLSLLSLDQRRLTTARSRKPENAIGFLGFVFVAHSPRRKGTLRKEKKKKKELRTRK